MNLFEATACLIAAIVLVPLFKMLRLGSVLGYLAAGVVLGPSVLHVVHDAHHTLHIAEFGVVLLLFLIGLELQPSRLWSMRSDVFGWGGLQVSLTTALLAGAGWAAGLSWVAALVVGFGLSLSSTAFAIQVLREKNEMALPHGQKAFGILLFQDVAAIPALALIPLLGGGATQDPMDALKSVGLAFGVILLVVAVGRFLMRPVFRFVMGSRVTELSSATALLLVMGTALLMTSVGLSAALGAFLAGVLLSDSEYRHELEADVEPFKGLLLGLFFMAVGMNANLSVLVSSPVLVAAGVVGLVAAKMLVLWGLAMRCRLPGSGSVRLAVTLSQGGEFAFVIFGVALQGAVLTTAVHDLLVVVVTLSMVTTPLLFLALDAWLTRRAQVEEREPDKIHEHGAPVIIAGFGRYGQIVGRMLRARRVRFTALDANAQDVDFVRRFGNNIYYGDASRLDLLRAAGAETARVLVVAVAENDSESFETSLRIVRVAQEHFPHLQIFARARNRPHAFELLAANVPHIARETFASSLETAKAVLEHLGYSEGDAQETLNRFREYDERILQQAWEHRHDQAELMRRGREANRMLEDLFEGDVKSDV
jgi:glutathione-regulated potassium-efflux system ancillary protein KefC